MDFVLHVFVDGVQSGVFFSLLAIVWAQLALDAALAEVGDAVLALGGLV